MVELNIIVKYKFIFTITKTTLRIKTREKRLSLMSRNSRNRRLDKTASLQRSFVLISSLGQAQAIFFLPNFIFFVYFRVLSTPKLREPLRDTYF